MTRTSYDPAAELAAAAGDLRQFAEAAELAGAGGYAADVTGIAAPSWDAEAHRTAAAILENWRQVTGEGTGQ